MNEALEMVDMEEIVIMVQVEKAGKV